jgi:polyhydroxyalkanoate synthase
MNSETTIDPKIMEEIIKFNKNVINAPSHVAAPDEIVLEVTPHDVVQEIDKTRFNTKHLC